jgi:hypothetical protein
MSCRSAMPLPGLPSRRPRAVAFCRCTSDRALPPVSPPGSDVPLRRPRASTVDLLLPGLRQPFRHVPAGGRTRDEGLGRGSSAPRRRIRNPRAKDGTRPQHHLGASGHRGTDSVAGRQPSRRRQTANTMNPRTSPRPSLGYTDLMSRRCRVGSPEPVRPWFNEFPGGTPAHDRIEDKHRRTTGDLGSRAIPRCHRR